MLERLGQTTDPETADEVAWRATLLPGPVKDANRLVNIAERAVNAKPGSLEYLETLGAAQYRVGNFQAAVNTLGNALSKKGPFGSAWMQIFLAMAHHQLKNEAKARECLDSARMLARHFNAIRWQDRVRSMVLCHEAESLIKGQSAAPKATKTSGK